MPLYEFDLIYRALKAMKGQAIVDHLVGLPLEANEPMKMDFPDEETLTLENIEEVLKKY